MISRCNECIFISIVLALALTGCDGMIQSLVKRGDVSGTVTGAPANADIVVVVGSERSTVYKLGSATHAVTGTTDANGDFTYSVSEVSVEVEQYAVAFVDTDGDGEFLETGSYIGASGVSYPSELIPGLDGNLTLVEGENNTADIVVGQYSAGGTADVNLQFVYGAQSGTEAGTAYAYIDTDMDPGNGVIDSYSEANTGNLLHEFTAVPNGRYYCYVHYDMDDSGTVNSGDLYGYYPSGNYGSPPSEPSLIVGIFDYSDASYGSFAVPIP